MTKKIVVAVVVSIAALLGLGIGGYKHAHKHKYGEPLSRTNESEVSYGTEDDIFEE